MNKADLRDELKNKPADMEDFTLGQFIKSKSMCITCLQLCLGNQLARLSSFRRSKSSKPELGEAKCLDHKTGYSDHPGQGVCSCSPKMSF